MTATAIRSTSARLTRQLTAVKDSILQEMQAHQYRPRVMRCLTDMLQGLETTMHEEITSGLDHIADCVEEDDEREAAWTRGCEEYHRRRDYEMEDRLDA